MFRPRSRFCRLNAANCERCPLIRNDARPLNVLSIVKIAEMPPMRLSEMISVSRFSTARFSATVSLVDAEQVVVALDERVAVVERTDLLVGVLADVVDEDLGELLAELGDDLVRSGVLGGDVHGRIRRVVHDDVDDIGHPGLGQQPLDDRGDRLLLVVCRDDAADRRALRR
jgi:hypothetical protein